MGIHVDDMLMFRGDNNDDFVSMLLLEFSSKSAKLNSFSDVVTTQYDP
jgi:hypothetical protein